MILTHMQLVTVFNLIKNSERFYKIIIQKINMNIVLLYIIYH